MPLALALEHGLTEHAGRAYGNLATCSILRHDPARAERYLRVGIAHCEEHEIHVHLAYLRAYAARFALEVLALLAGGHTNAELAQQLHLSTRTIDRHVSAILAKLRVRSRLEAAAAAFSLGIATPPG
ncbi:MAG TPA: helix-turn-helix transcriptional regulator [Woeseiaceae bacterium]|nr:helix-turn-helix transcriptional regulator [Woeseiaceae bacterium]